jgi:hypothetical protein
MSNPFDLRFAMITEAKNLLVEEYHSQSEAVKTQYFAEVEAGLNPSFPEMPKFPAFEDIRALANEMNQFVSNK